MRVISLFCFFFFSSRRRHTIFKCDWSSDVCSSDLGWCRRRSRRRLAPREAHMTSIDDPAALEVEDLAPHLDLFDPSHSERLWEVLSYARTACPVLQTDADEGYYVITRYDDLPTVLEDPQTYSPLQAGLPRVPLP